jgi:hypothetical protein
MCVFCLGAGQPRIQVSQCSGHQSGGVRVHQSPRWFSSVPTVAVIDQASHRRWLFGVVLTIGYSTLHGRQLTSHKMHSTFQAGSTRRSEEGLGSNILRTVNQIFMTTSAAEYHLWDSIYSIASPSPTIVRFQAIRHISRSTDCVQIEYTDSKQHDVLKAPPTLLYTATQEGRSDLVV